MKSKTTTTQKIGLVVLAIGIIYMFYGFLSSWWLVPDSREGADITGGMNGFIWSMSVPLGSYVALIGAGLYTKVEGRRILALVAVWFLMAAWFIFLPPNFSSAMFGIGGGLIMLLFLGVLWNWVTVRPRLSGSAASGADIQMLGYVFLVMAAWHLCGLLGPPFFALRPDLMDAEFMATAGVGQGSAIMVELVLGWALVFAGQRVALRERAVKPRDTRTALATD